MIYPDPLCKTCKQPKSEHVYNPETELVKSRNGGMHRLVELKCKLCGYGPQQHIAIKPATNVLTTTLGLTDYKPTPETMICPISIYTEE